MNTVAGGPVQVAIIRLGNVFRGDDGFGPMAVEMFRCEYEYDSKVEVLDLGTPGLHLAPYLYDRGLIVILDAVHTKLQRGTLSVFCEAAFISSRAKLRITGHESGVWDTLAHLRLAGRAPSGLIITGMTVDSCGFGEGLSSSALAMASKAAGPIAGLLAERGMFCHRRQMAHHPNLWWLPLAVGEPTDAA